MKNWGIIWYIAIDNSLGKGLSIEAQEKHINNISSLVWSNTGVQITILADFYGLQSEDGDQSGNTYRFRFGDGIEYQKEHLGEFDTSDASNLTEFISWSLQNTQTQKHMLILSDHGWGIDGGLVDDYNVEGAMPENAATLPEISNAIAAMQYFEKTPMHNFDIIGFDMCQMLQLEVCYQFRNLANYIIASEQEESMFDTVSGWDMESIFGYLRDTPTAQPLDVAKTVVDKTEEKIQSLKFSGTLSVIQTDRLENFVFDYIEQLGTSLSDAISYQGEAGYTLSLAIQHAARSYNSKGGGVQDLYASVDMILEDLGNDYLFTGVITALNHVKSARDTAEDPLIYSKSVSGYANLTGLSIQLGPSGGVTDSYLSLDFAQNTPRYVEFLQNFYAAYPYASSIAHWGVLIYLAYDNSKTNTDQKRQAVEDMIVQMQKSNIFSSQCIGTVMVDFCFKNKTIGSNDDEGNTFRYMLAYEEIAPTFLGEANMGSDQTLYEFLHWGLANISARKYMLIVADETSSPLNRYTLDNYIASTDSPVNESMTILDMQTAVQAACNNIFGKLTDNKFDVIGFDSNAMGIIEAGYQFKDQATNIIASQSASTVDWPYANIINTIATNNSADAKAMSSAIVDDIINAYSSAQQNGLYAVLDSWSLSTTISGCVADLVSELMKYLKQDETKEAVCKALSATNTPMDSYFHVDLKQWASDLITSLTSNGAPQAIISSAEFLVNVFDQAISYKNNTTELPEGTKNGLSIALKDLSDLPVAFYSYSGWKDFITLWNATCPDCE